MVSIGEWLATSVGYDPEFMMPAALGVAPGAETSYDPAKTWPASPAIHDLP